MAQGGVVDARVKRRVMWESSVGKSRAKRHVYVEGCRVREATLRLVRSRCRDVAIVGRCVVCARVRNVEKKEEMRVVGESNGLQYPGFGKAMAGLIALIMNTVVLWTSEMVNWCIESLFMPFLSACRERHGAACLVISFLANVVRIENVFVRRHVSLQLAIQIYSDSISIAYRFAI